MTSYVATNPKLVIGYN